MFCPEPPDQSGMLRIQYGRNGVVAVYRFYWVISSLRDGVFIFALCMIQIERVSGVMIAWWFMLAALMPPVSPRQLMTMALGARPPSRISSHPMMVLPLPLTNNSILRMKSLCRPCSSVRFCDLMRAWHTGHFFHRVFGHSSPPICIYGSRKQINDF